MNKPYKRIPCPFSEMYIWTNRSALLHAIPLLAMSSHSSEKQQTDLSSILELESNAVRAHSEGRLLDAIEAYERAIEICKDAKSETTSDYTRLLEKIAHAYVEAQEFKKAESCLAEALQLRTQMRSSIALPRSVLHPLMMGMEQIKAYDMAIALGKAAVTCLLQESSCYSLDTWVACTKLDALFQESKKPHDAIEFWEFMRDSLQDKLGGFHPRTLLSCEFLAFHHQALGIPKLPIQFTNYHDLISQHVTSDFKTEPFNPKEIIKHLLSIVYSSKEDPTKALASSNAMSLLVFMNAPLAGRDFSGVRIPGANLSGAVLSNTSFFRADLTGVVMTDAHLGKCILNEAFMENVKINGQESPFEGHSYKINCLSSTDLFGDRGVIISGGSDDTIKVWNLATGQVILQMRSWMNNVASVCSLRGPNGEKWIASGSGDRLIRIWNAEDGEQVKSFSGHSDTVFSLCAVQGTNKEPWLASCSGDNTIRIWDIQSDCEIRQLTGHLECINSICAIQGPKGESWLASASDDKTIRLWDISTGAEIRKLEGHEGWVMHVQSFVGPQGEHLLASSSDDKTVRIWDIKTGHVFHKLEGHEGRVFGTCHMEGSYGERWLISGSTDGTIRIWDAVTGALLKTVSGGKTEYSSIACTQGVLGEPIIVAARDDYKIQKWNLESLIVSGPIDVSEAHKDVILGLCSIPGPSGESLVVSAGGDNVLHLWNIAHGSKLTTFSGHTDTVWCVCYITGPGGELWIASGSDDSTIRVWDVLKGSQIKILRGHQDSVRTVCALKGPSGERWFGSSGSDKEILVWSLDTDSIILKLTGHTSIITSICPVEGSNGQHLIASASFDKKVIIWDYVAGHMVNTLLGHTDFVTRVCSCLGSSNENWLISSAMDKSVCIWNVETGEQVNRFVKHSEDVNCVCPIQGPNGERWIASGGRDETIVIYDLKTGKEVRSLLGHKGSVNGICTALNANGDMVLVSASGDRRIFIWPLITDDFGTNLKGDLSNLAVCGTSGPNESPCLIYEIQDGTLEVIDFESSTRIYLYEGHRSAITRVCVGKSSGGDQVVVSRSADGVIKIWDPFHKTELNNLHQQDVMYNKELDLVKVNEPGSSFVKFSNIYEANQLVYSSKDKALGPSNILGARKLEVGDIQILGTTGLSRQNKALLLNLGASSFDQDFLTYCQSKRPTVFQIEMAIKCFLRGWGSEKDLCKAVEWIERLPSLN